MRLNEENAEVLAPMDSNRFTDFMKISSFLWTACAYGEMAAFLIAMDESDESYGNENYRWFRNHYAHFLYVDRIVMDKPFRRIDPGTALYEKVFAYAK